MPHPLYRPRRLRESPLVRKMVRETILRTDDLVYPLFAVHGRGVREPIGPMPGQSRLSVDELLKECKDAASMGIPATAASSRTDGSRTTRRSIFSRAPRCPTSRRAPTWSRPRT